ncbi:probable ATP-dependent RNA helicase DDX27 [Anneissia japonica]|uniref:probable ATP-dependent RNA helicase DDX27 n=1 Tax=Anneissia japonica TaxID=1529436 RepID=UPI0014255304|nr:probable ATP-dependent RNA helicase DDX27 [Anneissia japonica]
MAAYRDDGFVGTIAEDDDISLPSEDTSSDEEAVVPKQKLKKKKKKVNNGFSTNFQFDEKAVNNHFWADDFIEAAKPKGIVTSTLEQKIAKIRRERKKKESKEEEKVDDAEKDSSDSKTEQMSDDDSDLDSDVETNKDIKIDKIRNKTTSEKRLEREKKKKGDDKEKNFFEDAPEVKQQSSFGDMNLSRPLLKALNAIKFTTPTPIQSKTIPIALLGKDICACAATGTGKTGAFMLPVLERLLYKPKEAPTTRVLVLVPTRELGVQVQSVTKQLCQFAKVDSVLAVGGLDIKLQEAALRKGPDIVIATPGRLIDHLHNAPNFSLSSIEILILDEADRMLDEFFEEQMKEIIRMCSISRQTMLFSATMTDEVKDLAAVSLKNPVKLFINENTDVAYNLRQEFIRIRPNSEGDREAIVAALCSRTFHDHCIVFIQTKKQAHRMHIILGLLGLNVSELHGNLSQFQRLEALRRFKEGQCDVLLATDLAARGLDIPDVKTVINFTMPNTLKHYVHRVGRTARAGRSGRSVTLVGEKERKLLKEIVKRAKQPVKSRVVPVDVIKKYSDKIEGMEDDVERVATMELEEKELRTSENQLNRAKAMLDNSRATDNQKRVWFQNHKQKMQSKVNQVLDKSGLDKKSKRKKGGGNFKKEKTTAEGRVMVEIEKSQLFAARAAKRDRKGKRLRAHNETDGQANHSGTRKKMKMKKTSFDAELTATSKNAVKQLRSKANTSIAEKSRQAKKTGTKSFKSNKRYKRR